MIFDSEFKIHILRLFSKITAYHFDIKHFSRLLKRNQFKRFKSVIFQHHGSDLCIKHHKPDKQKEVRHVEKMKRINLRTAIF